MKLIRAALISLSVIGSADAQTSAPSPTPIPAGVSGADVAAVSPALEKYRQHTLLGDLWKRPNLSPRDRSVVTVAALIARGQLTDLPFHLRFALDNGVKPAEISEIITHLAFYSGWGNAMGALVVARDVFAERKIGADQLPPADPKLLPLNQAAEDNRAKRVDADVGPISEGLVKYTGDVLFKDLWLRPDLAPRDRSLVTVTSLITNGQSAQLSVHLNTGMTNGITKEQVSEIISHLAFYAGWPNAFSAVPVAKAVFEARGK